MSNDENIRAVYEHEAHFSDYLDGLNRSAQRYYFFTFGAIGAAILQIYFKSPCGHMGSFTLSCIVNLCAVLLLIFGVVTIVRLGGLRALSIRADRRVDLLTQELLSRTNLGGEFLRRREFRRREKLNVNTKGNAWANALFVAIGNSVCICIILFSCLGGHRHTVVVLPLAFFFSTELSMFVYGVRLQYRCHWIGLLKEVSWNDGLRSTVLLDVLLRECKILPKSAPNL
jgi:hypothetical protein